MLFNIIGVIYKIKLKSKELAISKFNIEIDNRINFNNLDKDPVNENLILPKLELKAPRFSEDLKTDEASPDNNEDLINMNLKEYFEKKDRELNELSTLSGGNINYVNVPLDSFDVEVDIVNHISESGGLENLKLEINEKKSHKN